MVNLNWSGMVSKKTTGASESDPLGYDQHEPGAKVDDGKIRVNLVLGAFARALYAVCGVGTFGAAKYSDDGWLQVPEGEGRYADARGRHWLKDEMGDGEDDQTNLLHMAHDAWNSLARLELRLRDEHQESYEFIEELENTVKEAIAKLPEE